MFKLVDNRNTQDSSNCYVMSWLFLTCLKIKKIEFVDFVFVEKCTKSEDFEVKRVRPFFKSSCQQLSNLTCREHLSYSIFWNVKKKDRNFSLPLLLCLK
jgi:hypothetical protein